MFSIAVAVIYGIIGVLAIVGGYVAGFVMTVVYLALPLLISVPILLYYLIAPAAGWRVPPAQRRCAAMGAIVFSYVSIIIASPMSNARDETRLARGSEVASLVEEYQRVTGEYPQHLDELASAGLDVPPELLEGVYYAPDEALGYEIQVPNDAMMLCTRTAEMSFFMCTD